MCLLFSVFVCFFFFQAEDGIRDDLVTGVQTCALPILPAQFTYGNSGRNILNAAPLRQLDMTVLKRFRITERKRLEYRTEFFNIPNHPVFAIPVTTIDTPTAGRVTSTLNSGRILQFALKFSF